MAQEVDPSMAETGQRAAPCPRRNQGKQPGPLWRCLDHELGVFNVRMGKQMELPPVLMG